MMIGVWLIFIKKVLSIDAGQGTGQCPDRF